MGRCKNCDSIIEDGLKVCPLCKAIQTDTKVSKNVKQSAYDRYMTEREKASSNINSTLNTTKNKTKTTINNGKINTEKDIHQIAQDIHFIKIVIEIGLCVSVVSAIIILILNNQ